MTEFRRPDNFQIFARLVDQGKAGWGKERLLFFRSQFQAVTDLEVLDLLTNVLIARAASLRNSTQALSQAPIDSVRIVRELGINPGSNTWMRELTPAKIIKDIASGQLKLQL